MMPTRIGGRLLLNKLNLLSSKPIFGLMRGSALDVLVHGFFGITVNGETLTPNTLSLKFSSRSLLKPWQFLNTGIFNKEKFWAMGLSSSSGQPIHTEALRKLSAATDIDISTLVCPDSYPYDFAEMVKLVSNDVPKNKIYHFCCGKHLLMKYACKKIGSNPETYYAPENKLQQNLFNLINSITAEKNHWVIDSCGVPTLFSSMKGHLDIWNTLSEKNDKKIRYIRNIWAFNPELIGGINRIDSCITKVSEGKVLAKEGADGLLALQYFDEKKNERFTLILKLSQSVPDSYLGLALISILSKYSSDLPNTINDVLQYLRTKMNEWIKKDQQFITFC